MKPAAAEAAAAAVAAMTAVGDVTSVTVWQQMAHGGGVAAFQQI
jgi:hypothetical protein